MTPGLSADDADEPVPAAIRAVGFDFHWDETKVWALDVPWEDEEIQALLWHLDLPFLSERGPYDLKPRDVLDDPGSHAREWERTMRADLSHPLDVMENKGRWLLLDGLHRLMKAHATGMTRVRVRRIPRALIPRIAIERPSVEGGVGAGG